MKMIRIPTIARRISGAVAGTIAALAWLCVVAPTARAEAAEGGKADVVATMRVADSLLSNHGKYPDGDWLTQVQYLSGRQADDAVPWEFFCTHYRQSGQWTTIPVPSCWEQHGFGRYLYGYEEHEAAKKGSTEPAEQGLYRHRFTVPAEWSGRRVFLVFDGVMTDAEVKLNGALAGPVHQGAFYRFKYDVTSLLKPGESNLLEVTVSKKSANESVNRAERYADYWVMGGIFRPVWLQAVPAQFIEHLAIDARHDGAFAMNYELSGEGKADAVEVELLDAKGRQVIPLVAVPAAAGKVAARVDNPAAWTAETPSLYTAVVRLKEGKTVRHEIRQRFGFRTIEIRKGDGIYVNGRRVILKGTSRHSFWPDTGRTLTEKIHRLDIGLIKEMNMNAVRATSYPPDAQFLDLCDEEGLYVLDELGGWQQAYDTEVGRKLVAEMVRRDVNHPSILFWNNGNEHGWNTVLDGEFAKHDPQQRPVLHPMECFSGIQTKHYPEYETWLGLLAGPHVVMPTEFMHALNDGGGGTGLADYWSVLRKSPQGAGGFIWAFLDEDVRRTDKNNVLDSHGDSAPDGLVGPYREKEASFFTVKELWSPIQIARQLPADFQGALAVQNDYHFLNLNQCRFSWQLRRFGVAPGFAVVREGAAAAPDISPGASGTLSLDLPSDFRSADALALKATDPAGREIWTWVWPLQPFRSAAEALVSSAPAVEPVEKGGEVRLSAAGTEARIEKATGRLLGLSVHGRPFSLSSLPGAQIRWTMLQNGWLKLEYSVEAPAIASATADPKTPPQAVIPGVAFNYPEKQMRGKTWLGEGPYRVWRNRLLGGTLSVWETPYNETDTGNVAKEIIYPEFSGFFAAVRWMKLCTTEGTLTMAIPDEGTFVRVGTPAHQWVFRLKSHECPPCNLAVVHDIPAVGNKFFGPAKTGPQGATPLSTGPWSGTLYMKVEPCGSEGTVTENKGNEP